ncbi:SEC10/PgrA surface exclusion domain-containing protein [Pediococcus pentosaceus]|uniref:SEC10/PgrA surface exclusion domain-containing protein n=1 Tax=Pediococcus pentosaceus TaxID=1255 RepID=UPI0021A27747|nr:SEC10/PgrA surface exclusion domain-containing protein [Pediococcus pentosaceus]MCT3019893.1 SEC10/PgrA surface exclusion domain-containing protein [Pediococcus pentosaceus]
MKNLKLANNDTIHRVKMFKAKKAWIAMGTSLAIMGGSAVLSTANADTINNSVANSNDTTTISQTSTIKTNVQPTTLTKNETKNSKIDDAKNAVQNDTDSINDTKSDINDAKNQQTSNNSEINQDQTAINNTQNDLNDAKKQHDQDQQNADSLAPDGYEDKENNVSKANDAVNNAQNTVNNDQTKVNNATNDKNKAQTDVNNAQKNADTQQSNANSAASKADDAKNQLDSTDKTINVHHPAKPAKPGTLQEGTVINSENELPDHLVKPSDADKYNSYAKQQAGGATINSYWNYVGDDDHSSIIVDNHLTPQQQLEAAQYALTLINDFRRQHGLPPMKMSQISIQLAQNDANMRNQYGVASSDHSYPGSEDQGGVTQEQWDNAMMRTIDANFDTAKDQSHNYFAADQNLGDISMDYVPTMLALKVRILQIIQDMAYADADWDWMHTQAFLRDTPNIIGNNEKLDNIWFGLNIVSPDEYGTSAVLFDMFETWDTSNGQTDKINKTFDQNQVAGYVNNGYDTVENNPAYAKAQTAYTNAQEALKTAQNNLKNALSSLSNAKSNLNNKVTAVNNAINQLAQDNAKLSAAKTTLANATTALENAKKEYANQLPAYEAALKTVDQDQSVINALNSKLSALKKDLANHQTKAKTINSNLNQLEQKLSQLEQKLQKDQDYLAQLINQSNQDNNNDGNSDSNGNSDNTGSNSNSDSDNNTNNPGTDTNTDDSNQNSNDGHNGTSNSNTTDPSDTTNGGSTGANSTDNSSHTNTNSGNKQTPSNSGLADNGNATVTPNHQDSNAVTVEQTGYTNGATRTSRTQNQNEKAVPSRMSYYHFSQKSSTKLEQKQSKDTLPQTGENQQKDETIAVAGSILAMAVSALGLVGLKRRRNNK